MARQYLSAGKPRDPKTRKHWNFFVNSMLGPAQNPDGSLKEADQIEDGRLHEPTGILYLALASGELESVLQMCYDNMKDRPIRTRYKKHDMY